jgi:hypothetical protein
MESDYPKWSLSNENAEQTTENFAHSPKRLETPLMFLSFSFNRKMIDAPFPNHTLHRMHLVARVLGINASANAYAMLKRLKSKESIKFC